MGKWRERVREFWNAEDGPTAVEYAFMLAVIIAVCVAAIKAVGNNTQAVFSNSSLQNAVGS